MFNQNLRKAVILLKKPHIDIISEQSYSCSYSRRGKERNPEDKEGQR